MEFKKTPKNLNGMSTLFSWLKPDPFSIRVYCVSKPYEILKNPRIYRFFEKPVR